MVPDGVTVYVTTSDLNMQGAPSAQLRSPDSSAGEIDGPMGKMVALTKVNQSAKAVWEWIAEDPRASQRVDTVSFGVAVVAKLGEFGWGSCSVQGSLHPLSTVFVASHTAPVPRFAVPSSDLLTLSFNNLTVRRE